MCINYGRYNTSLTTFTSPTLRNMCLFVSFYSRLIYLTLLDISLEFSIIFDFSAGLNSKTLHTCCLDINMTSAIDLLNRFRNIHRPVRQAARPSTQLPNSRKRLNLKHHPVSCMHVLPVKKKQRHSFVLVRVCCCRSSIQRHRCKRFGQCTPPDGVHQTHKRQ